MARMDIRGRGENDGKPASVGGRLGLSLFFFFFFAIGSLFELFILHEFAQAVGQRGWRKVPCRIVGSDVNEQVGETRYVFTVRYEYGYEGKLHVGTAYKRKYSGSENYSDAHETAQKYPVSMQTFCYVNPASPGEAVLKRASLLVGFVAFFPLIFVCIGAGGIYFIWRKAPAGQARPIAAIAVRRSGKGRYAMVGFFAIFGIAGGAMLYPLGIRPIARTIDAESWIETPCRVLNAEVRSHDSDDGTTYSVYILYQYEFEGRTYKHDRYDFVGGSSSGYRGKARTVAIYESAASPVCYVNPDRPSEAVLKRGFHAKLLFALFPLPFLLVGVGGIIGTLRRKMKPDSVTGLPHAAWPQRTAASAASVLTMPGTGPVTLKPQHTPALRLAGAILIALFWNGIVSVFLFQAVEGFRHGDPSWFLALFLVPFVLIGLGLMGMVVHQFLAMFNPRPTLELSSGRIPLGGAAELGWRLSGRTSRIEELTVTLRGVEEAKYTKGTSTYTDHNTFYEMELYKTTDAYGIAAGQVGFVLPQETMHSFEAENNKILWSLDLHGRIRHWPDVKESFKITVTPTAI